MNLSAPGAATVAHLAATCAYAGFQWTIAALVYPQIATTGRTAPGTFPAYEEWHARRTAFLVAPMFAALVGATVWLVVSHPDSVLAWAAAAMTALVLVVTAAGAVPQHERLKQGFDEDAMRALRRADALRTVAASAQVVLAVALVVVS